jgi:hypothetical protein
MSHKRTPLRPLAVWALCGLAFGTLAVGCGGSPPPPPPVDTSTPAPPPPPPPVVSTSNEPTAADVAAARPKDITDPFTKPAFKGATIAIGPASPAPSSTPTVADAGKGKGKGKGKGPVAVVPTPEAPKTPPTPPTVIAVGIFASKHGPEAILADKGSSGGTLIVTTGYRLSDGGYVKSIDPVSRKVVIDKENTDFVLPLEAAPSGSPSPSTPGK